MSLHRHSDGSTCAEPGCGLWIGVDQGLKEGEGLVRPTEDPEIPEPRKSDDEIWAHAQSLSDEVRAQEAARRASAEEVDDEKQRFNDALNMLAMEYDQRMIERHDMGREKYGPGKFLTVDTLEEAIQEIIDLGNYAKYTYIKLRLLQEYLATIIPDDGTPDSGFIKASDMLKGQR